MAISGAVLFFYLAGCKGKIQTGGFGNSLGYITAIGYDGDVYTDIQQSLKCWQRWYPLPGVCIERITDLEYF